MTSGDKPKLNTPRRDDDIATPHVLNLDQYSMTALPPADRRQIGNMEPNALSTYNVCLDFEREAAAKTDINTTRARVLGY